jgi:hypothetical protein
MIVAMPATSTSAATKDTVVRDLKDELTTGVAKGYEATKPLPFNRGPLKCDKTV